MFRSTALLIVLTLAAGPNASLLCAAWCHSEAAASSPCGHPGSTSASTVIVNGSCPDIASVSIVLAREDARRGASGSQIKDAVAVPSFRFAPTLSQVASACAVSQSPALESRPLTLSLRL